MSSPSPRATLAVVISAIGFGLSPYLGTRSFAAGVDPAAASFIRIAVLCVALSPFAGHLRAWKRESVIVAVGGAVSMLGFTGYFVALDRAPVAAATVVYYTYPAVVLVLSAALWKQRLRTRDLAVCAMVVGGVALSVGPTALSTDLAVALLPALAAPLGWAIYLLVLSGPAAAMPTLPKVFAGSCGGTAALLPLAVWRTGGDMMPVTTPAITSIGLLTLCTLAIPALLVTWGAPRTGERATAMIGSVEFIVALTLSWLLTGAELGSAQLVGVAFVVLAATLGGRQPRRIDRVASDNTRCQSSREPLTVCTSHPASDPASDPAKADPLAGVGTRPIGFIRGSL